MIQRHCERLILRPEGLVPLHDGFEVIGVFNPGATRCDDRDVLLVRVAERPRESRAGFLALPRYAPNGDVVIDWFPSEEWDRTDPRVVRRRSDGLARLTSISHLRVYRATDDGATCWTSGALFLPDLPEEEFGVEDPRITEIAGKFWLTYVAVSRHGAATSIASTADFESFQRHGVIFCPENKDVALFPQTINGEYVALHRPTGRTRFSAPEIWIARSPNLIYWGGHKPMLSGHAAWEAGRIGGGPPPIDVEDGWLVVYHGAEAPNRSASVAKYSAGAALLDRSDPLLVLSRSRTPIMQATAGFERNGFVHNVVFPTGLIARGDKLRIYYGAADARVGCVELHLPEILASLDEGRPAI